MESTLVPSTDACLGGDQQINRPFDQSTLSCMRPDRDIHGVIVCASPTAPDP